MSNLVENSLRCTPAGGTVTLAVAGGELTVKDTGPGISPDEIPHAFDRFFLYRRYNGDRPVGTGLGLAIVRELTQAMGGEARVASSSTGTEFTICLPLPASENQLDALHAFTRS